MIRFTCSQCGKPLRAPADKVGALARCPSCGNKSRIPAPAPLRPIAPEEETPNVELVEDETPEAPATSRGRSRPKWGVARLFVSLVAIVIVLLASIYAGMAGGQAGAPKSWAEFKARLFREAPPEEQR